MAYEVGKGDFIANLGKIYGYYTGGFVAFTIMLGILEYMGVPNKVIGYLYIFMTIGIYALIGVLSRTSEVSEYYVAGRRVPAFYNGMATGADWMSAASFISMAGGLYLQGYDGLAYVLGWTGGYVLVGVLLAPYLRKFGQFTVPDFLGTRYGGHVARFIGILVLLAASFTYVVAQVFGVGIITSRFLGMSFELAVFVGLAGILVCSMLGGILVLLAASFTYVVAQVFGVGIITSRFLGMSFELAVFVGLAGILVCSMLGGMRAVTWTQVAQYIILIVAYLIPVIWLSAKKTGVPIPEIMYGKALASIGELEKTLGVVKGHTAAFADAQGNFSWVRFYNYFFLIFCLMVGTASLPHILMRYFTTPSVRDARLSVGWSIFFIFLLYFTAPAYAAFAKWEVYTAVVGQPIASLPAWVQNWSQVAGMLTIRDANNDGILQLAELTLNQDIIVLATPEIAGLPYVISGLVAAGGLAAALSTADGLLLAIANALSHDIYYKMIDPRASTVRRLTVSRVLLLVVAVIAAYTASTRPSGIIQMVAWAFSIAAAGLFAPLVLGIWWKRANAIGACCGMIAGFGSCLFYLIGTRYFDMPLWWGINNVSCGIFGIPLSFLVTYVVSMMTAPPSKEMQDFIDSIRVPRGDVVAIGGQKAE